MSDGTAAGSSEIVPGTQSAYSLGPGNLTTLGNKALFSGTDSSGNIGLWVTDGTAAGSSRSSRGRRAQKTSIRIL